MPSNPNYYNHNNDQSLDVNDLPPEDEVNNTEHEELTFVQRVVRKTATTPTKTI